MIKKIVSAPPREEKYRDRLGFKDVKVINGASPNGRLPKVIGSGIFGHEGQDGGIFSGSTEPLSDTGIFFNDYAQYDYEKAQPDVQWSLLRRPGRPLYPGSSSYGIVLTGPSMGTDENAAPNRLKSVLLMLGLGALIGVGLDMLVDRYRG
jgi:hypothetical protein